MHFRNAVGTQYPILSSSELHLRNAVGTQYPILSSSEMHLRNTPGIHLKCKIEKMDSLDLCSLLSCNVVLNFQGVYPIFRQFHMKF
jgi:hypothetical protein